MRCLTVKQSNLKYIHAKNKQTGSRPQNEFKKRLILLIFIVVELIDSKKQNISTVIINSCGKRINDESLFYGTINEEVKFCK